MAEEKKSFSWDSEKVLNTVEVSAYVQKRISECTLKGKTYVVLNELKKIKGEWKIIKGFTVPKEHFTELVEPAL